MKNAVKLLEHKTFTFARVRGLEYNICLSDLMQTNIAQIEQKTKLDTL